MKRIHTVCALQYRITAIVSDGNVSAAQVDANLKNSWGNAFNPKSVVWVAK
jgi:hypothetical protein